MLMCVPSVFEVTARYAGVICTALTTSRTNEKTQETGGVLTSLVWGQLKEVTD